MWVGGIQTVCFLLLLKLQNMFAICSYQGVGLFIGFNCPLKLSEHFTHAHAQQLSHSGCDPLADFPVLLPLFAEGQIWQCLCWWSSGHLCYMFVCVEVSQNERALINQLSLRTLRIITQCKVVKISWVILRVNLYQWNVTKCNANMSVCPNRTWVPDGRPWTPCYVGHLPEPSPKQLLHLWIGPRSFSKARATLHKDFCPNTDSIDRQ